MDNRGERRAQAVRDARHWAWMSVHGSGRERDNAREQLHEVCTQHNLCDERGELRLVSRLASTYRR
jgi:hypothetical protein